MLVAMLVVGYYSSSNSLVTMRSFAAVLACLAVAGAQYALPAGYNAGYPYAGGYAGYPYAGAIAAPALASGYAAAPALAAGYTAAPLAAPTAYAPVAVAGGVYAGAAYDPSVAYANLYPAAEPYIHQEI